MERKYKRLKYACYMTSTSMSIGANLSPLLFLTFREMYHISYSLLGLLILINFVTQLGVDLVFSFFSHKFHIPKTILANPLFATFGLIIFSIYPLLFPETAYVGLVIGTLLFSASGGLGEVLMSPIIASIPAKEPEREMSKLHSVYAWGTVFVVISSTLFLFVFGAKNWHWLALIFSLIPLSAFLLYCGTEIPELETPQKTSGVLVFMKNKMLWICVLMIFFGGASEVAMSQWSSSFLEQGLGIPKVWGDVFGVALFAATLGLGRSLYAKIGKNITKVLLFGIIGSTICYFTTAVSQMPIVGIIACVLTGLTTSMLWPGNIIVSSDLFPNGGLFIYAFMAAAGDLGASVVPQLIGIVTDIASIHFASEQIGMRLGMLVATFFPLIAIPFYIFMHRKRRLQ